MITLCNITYLLLAPEIKGSDVIVIEDAREAVVQIKRNGSLKSVISGYVTTVDGTAIGMESVSVIFK